MKSTGASDIRRLHIVALGAVVVLAALLASRSRALDPLREGSSRPVVSAAELGSRDLARLLSALETLHPRPVPRVEGERRYRSRPLEPSFALEPLRREELRPALGIELEWLHRGVPAVSLLLDPGDLAELTGNTEGRGAKWERPAHFTYVEDGEVRFSDTVGVRIHGGGGRRRNRFGYRVYFRRRHGSQYLPSEIFPTGGALPARTVVLRRDGGRGRHGIEWTFVNAIGNEIGRRLGLAAPASKPVVLFVNGRAHSVRALVERIDERFLESHFGHRDFTMVRTKVNRGEERPGFRFGDAERWGAFERWARSRQPLEVEEVEARVDLDNFIRWALLHQVLGTGDMLQGPLLLDHRAETPRWFTMPWDMDISLGIWGDALVEVNRLDYFSPQASRRDSRISLLTRLLHSSDAFKARFASHFDEIDNHLLTREFQHQLLDPYFDEAARFGLDPRFLVSIRRYLRQRGEVLRSQLGEQLGLGPSYPVEVHVPWGREVWIDGHPWDEDFIGARFEGTTLELDARDEPDFGGWSIDGVLLEQPEQRLAVDRPLSIEFLTSSDA